MVSSLLLELEKPGARVRLKIPIGAFLDGRPPLHGKEATANRLMTAYGTFETPTDVCYGRPLWGATRTLASDRRIIAIYECTGLNKSDPATQPGHALRHRLLRC